MDCIYLCFVWESDSDWVRIMIQGLTDDDDDEGFPSCGHEKNCTLHENSHCSPSNQCLCNVGYQWNYLSLQCQHKDAAVNQKDDIYRTAMITSACFLFAILLLLVICVIKRSFCDRGIRSHARHRAAVLRPQEISTISGLNVLTMTPSRMNFMRYLVAMEKPPTYDESMRMSIPNTVSSTENVILPPSSPPPYFLNDTVQEQPLDDFPPPDVSSIASSTESTCTGTNVSPHTSSNLVVNNHPV